ncbi:hypothetical protein [Micromonospora thermarum]|uniref:Uncharacterized protein n=1 Tax=Micromonospora thermarum TaxID=2720024 RepID=A0ABX0ZDT7_9ACTN|nr:hypothetical protein [Micromonospora thermarum]NJP35223.1 hypothetical protein [Micromonospora thermarum]
MLRLRGLGVPPMIRGWHDWLQAHRPTVRAVTTQPRSIMELWWGRNVPDRHQPDTTTP